MNQSGLAGLSDGFVVIAPRILTDLVYDNESGYNYHRNRVDRRAAALGLRLLGMEQIALSHLLRSVTNELGVQDLSQVIYGVSLGGLVAFYQAALNPEIDAVIVSQWAEDRFEKLASPSYPHAMWRFESGDYSITTGSA
jgi:dienelactone hydrolase